MKQQIIRYLSVIRRALETDRQRQLLANRVIYCGDHVVLTTLPNGRYIYLDMRDTAVAPRIALGKAYEPHVSGTLARLARPGDTFFDVGANMGYHALMLSQHLRHDQVSMHLFEPNPTVLDCLRRTVHVNAMWTSTRVNGCALSDREGTASLRIFEDLMGSGTVTNVENVHEADHPWYKPNMETTTFEVATRTLDSYCHEFDVASIELMKLDVEGHEESTIAGMTHTLERSKDLRLVMEFTPGAYSDGERFWNHLMDIFPHRFIIASRDDLIPVKKYEALRSHMKAEMADVLLSKIPVA